MFSTVWQNFAVIGRGSSEISRRRKRRNSSKT